MRGSADDQTTQSRPSPPPALAWRWRQLIERGEVTTLADLAAKECFSDRYVSRIIRLAWLSPPVLEQLVMHREPTVLTLKDLCGVAELPWADQPGRVFD